MTEHEKLVIAAATAHDGKKTLPCAKAFALAERHGISVKEIGEICDRHGVKIIHCQLGCFK